MYIRVHFLCVTSKQQPIRSDVARKSVQLAPLLSTDIVVSFRRVSTKGDWKVLRAGRILGRLQANSSMSMQATRFHFLVAFISSYCTFRRPKFELPFSDCGLQLASQPARRGVPKRQPSSEFANLLVPVLGCIEA